MSKFITVLFIVLCAFSISSVQAQSFAFGAKGGVGLGTQKWDLSDKSPLFIYSVTAFVESENDYNNNNFFAQVGYHTRGSAIISPGYNYNGTSYPRRSQRFVFRNAELSLGFKQTKPVNDALSLYYKIGLRGEYNINTNLSDFETLNGFSNNYYPVDEGVKKILYGFTIQGGVDFMFSELYGGVLEFSFYPDVSNQYYSPPIDNVINPNNPGSTVNLQERRIKNLSFEVSVGFRLLRKVEYIED